MITRKNERKPAVAGMFYPSDAVELRRMVEGMLCSVESGPHPKALIVPHAGYIYSGVAAAAGYARVDSQRVTRVVVMGPSHQVPLRGIAGSGAAYWRTPLGRVESFCPEGVVVNDVAHGAEHSIEVQLPFLQVQLAEFTFIPLVTGSASAEETAGVLRTVWGGPETVVVISSDLSHYEAYGTAQRMDRAAAKAIVALDEHGLDPENACGRVPVRGLLRLAAEKGLRAECVCLCNSGDTAGPRDQVVGYGTFAFYDQDATAAL